jgi:L-rhamnose mutarotase
VDEYKARHAVVWPEMLDALRQTGWRNYSLFLCPDSLLVGYLECDDFAGCRAAMKEHAPWQRRWLYSSKRFRRRFHRSVHQEDQCSLSVPFVAIFCALAVWG